MAEQFISDKGELLTAGAFGLGLHLRCRLDPQRAAKYAVHNLGFVRIRRFRGAAELIWRKATVAPSALVTLLHWASDQSLHRFGVTVIEPDAVRTRIVPDRVVLTRMVLECLEMRERNACREMNLNFLNRLRNRGASPFTNLVQRFRAECNDLSKRQDPRSLCQELFGDRFFLASPMSQGAHFQIRSCGTGYGFLPKGVNGMLPQMRVADAPDYYYGKWLNAAFNRVLASDTEIFDDVDAYIYLPKSGRQRFTYTRAIVPFSLPTGEKLLLSTSQTDSSVDLRFMA
jgi:hypothetical protein